MSASFAYRRLSYLSMPFLLHHLWPHGEKDTLCDISFVTATLYSGGAMGFDRAKEFLEWCLSELMDDDSTVL